MNKLEQYVTDWITEKAEDYPDTGKQGVLEDLQHGGCSSGMVGELISYCDITAFFEKHKADINSLLGDVLSGSDISVQGLFKGWDEYDPLALDVTNQNLLAWFGFEETANRLESELV